MLMLPKGTIKLFTFPNITLQYSFRSSEFAIAKVVALNLFALSLVSVLYIAIGL